MEKHEWRDRTADGAIRLVTARFHAGNWSLQSRLKSEDEWILHDPMPLEDLEVLRDLLWRKYQRRRVPYSHVESIDAMIEKLRPEEPGMVEEGDESASEDENDDASTAASDGSDA